MHPGEEIQYGTQAGRIRIFQKTVAQKYGIRVRDFMSISQLFSQNEPPLPHTSQSSGQKSERSEKTGHLLYQEKRFVFLPDTETREEDEQVGGYSYGTHDGRGDDDGSGIVAVVKCRWG